MLSAVKKTATAAAKKAKEIAKRKAIAAAKDKKAKELKANQQKPINELMSKTPAAQAESGMGTASKTRIISGERGKAMAGAKKEYKATLNKLDNDPNLSDEQMDIMMGKLKNLEKRYGPEVKASANMSKGGMATKNYANPVTIVDNRKKK